MPQSPYRTTVYPPIEHLDSFREILTRQRLSYDDDERDKEAEITLLDVGDDLLAHCKFLETKLNIKKREFAQLVAQNNALTKQNDALKNQSETLKQENVALKEENEALKEPESQTRNAANEVGHTIHQPSPDYEETDVEVHSSTAATPQLENGTESPKNVGVATRKRGIGEVWAVDEVGTSKKKKT